MFTRILLACAVCLASALPIQAEPTVYFRGKQLTKSHFVYGEVTSASRLAGTINLGFGHGLQEGQEVGVLRLVAGNLVPLGTLRMTKVRPAESLGQYAGGFRLRRDDLVIVAARDLNLWQGRTRSDQLVIETLIDRMNSRGYDTAEVSSALLNEVGRDDRLVTRKPPELHVNFEEHATRRKPEVAAVTRGAFRLADSTEDDSAKLLSLEDRRLSPDTSTLDLETGLARFVISNSINKVDAHDDLLRQIRDEDPSLGDIDDIQSVLRQENARIRDLIHKKK